MSTSELPTGIQDFETLRTGGFLYVDKTQYVYELLRPAAAYYFLQRPRRFGKSLLLSTIAAAMRGQQELFEGLFLAKSDFAFKEYPVVELHLNEIDSSDAESFRHSLGDYLDDIAAQFSLRLADGDNLRKLRLLIQGLAVRDKVVVLIDEYDRPIIQHLSDKASEEALDIRRQLRAFFAVLKTSSKHLRLLFLTGISRFSQVGVFSGLNNLVDISMDPKFAAIAGMTEDELKRVFSQQLAALADSQGLGEVELFDKVRRWYNGFRFTAAEEAVYNPFSSLLMLKHQGFKPFWFSSGTPYFLSELMRKQAYPLHNLEYLPLPYSAFDAYDLEHLSIEALLFQTGYLTIRDVQDDEHVVLSHPNYEVEKAFTENLLERYTGLSENERYQYLEQVRQSLSAQDLDTFVDLLNHIISGIPYQLHVNQDRYYHSIIHSILKLAGFRVISEYSVAQGRIDTALFFEGARKELFLFEFKLDKTAEIAMKQLKEKHYSASFEMDYSHIFLLAINIDGRKRCIDDVAIEKPF